ncbi:MAG: urease accessory protein UreF [Clostridium sp.]|nr:urease accessory protein UreF [Clostridium sp.]
MLFTPAAPITITEDKLLSLWQVCDSFFPTGGYTQSYGLETYIQLGLVRDEASLTDFLSTYLTRSAARSDGLAIRLAYRAIANGEIDILVKLDEILEAQKLAREPREASVKIGRQLLNTIKLLLTTPVLDSFISLVKEGKVQGHKALAFAILGHGFDWGEDLTVLAFMYSTASGMVNNAIRAVPLGQTTGQNVLQNLRVGGFVALAAAMSKELTIDDLGAVSPGLEIRAMQHEQLYSRLFAS